MKILGQLNYAYVWRHHVLSNDGMTLPLQGQGHSIRVTEIEKNGIFQ